MFVDSSPVLEMEIVDLVVLAVPGSIEFGATVADPMIDGRRRSGYVTELLVLVVQHNIGAVDVFLSEVFFIDQFLILELS